MSDNPLGVTRSDSLLQRILDSDIFYSFSHSPSHDPVGGGHGDLLSVGRLRAVDRAAQSVRSGDP